ncbi:B12-binding domain-containing radical SAM protein, partial [candidate division CSSED10-310 bacterium]
MELMLVNSYFLERDANEQKVMKPYPALGILYLAAVAKQAGHSVHIFDGTFETFTAYRTTIQLYKPDLIGIYANVITRENALEMMKIAREMKFPVVLGGPDPSADAAEYLQAGALAIVAGEGEQTLVELLSLLEENPAGEELRSIAGLVLAQNGQLYATGIRKRIRDLDALPLPDRDALNMEQYLTAWQSKHSYSSLNLITSRGCPYHCTW